jgi:hypothetical protein
MLPRLLAGLGVVTVVAVTAAAGASPGRAVATASPTRFVGTGTAASCTSSAVVRAVARGGVIRFRCGPKPLTITMRATAKVTNTSHRIVIDGGGLVTLSGAGQRQILYLNTCDPRRTYTTSHCDDQRWPSLLVENITLAEGNATVTQSKAAYGGGGGGAIFDRGGQLKVVNSHFVDNRCYHVGPDLGGAAIRALEQFHNRPVYVIGDTFRGGRCSNGGALSSIGVSWVVVNSVMTDNRAIGRGANPASAHSPGGGSGGAIYTDGDHYTVTIKGSTITNNHAKAGGGAVFFVSDDNTGSMTIGSSTLHDNPNLGFYTRPYPGIFYQSAGHPLKVHKSTIN